MIGLEDAPHTYEYDDHFKILPMIYNWSLDPERINDGKKVADDFVYTSDSNSEWMECAELSDWIENNRHKIGTI